MAIVFDTFSSTAAISSSSLLSLHPEKRNIVKIIHIDFIFNPDSFFKKTSIFLKVPSWTKEA
jgi:hypothetical protein